MDLEKAGTFGWTRFTYVAELTKRTRTGPSFALRAPGLLWIDDVSVERVGSGVELTAAAEWGNQEAPIAPPGPLGVAKSAVPNAATGTCRPGEMLRLRHRSCRQAGGNCWPPERLITSFEESNPFTGGVVVEEHATDGRKALRIDSHYVAMRQPQDWSGYDLFKMDLYTDARDPLPLTLEFWDRGTTGIGPE